MTRQEAKIELRGAKYERGLAPLRNVKIPPRDLPSVIRGETVGLVCFDEYAPELTKEQIDKALSPSPVFE